MHVTDSSVLFSATGDIPVTPGLPPVQGAGRRMMWYPDKAAFRVGSVNGGQWNKDSIGNYSFASGYGTTASGIISTAMGFVTTASGNTSTAIGAETTASGIVSTAMGYFAIASGYTSTAMGYRATASGYTSIAMGSETTAKSGYETVLGRWNTGYTPASTSGWDLADRLFTIGNGTGAGAASSNAMTVLKNGNTGIGTSTPVARLHVADSSVLFSADGDIPGIQGLLPKEGPGRRMMWYPNKAAFRVGYVFDDEWNLINMGDYSFASGHRTKASGYNATAMGSRTTASGIFSTAMGANSNAPGNLSTAIGSEVQTIGDYSVAIGESVTANAYKSTSFGSHNDPMVTSSTTSWVLTEPLLIIGNGTSPVDKKNALVILKNGNAGIGTSNPQSALHIGNSGQLRMYDASGTRYAQLFHSGSGDLHLSAIGGGASYINWFGGASLHVGNGLFGYGPVHASAFTVSSSQLFKKNIVNTHYGLAEILKLQGKEYQYSNDITNRKELGLIAEEVELVVPEVVYHNPANKKVIGIDYGKLVTVLIESIKEQQVMIEELKIKNQNIDKQQQQIDKQQKQIDELGKLVEKLLKQ